MAEGVSPELSELLKQGATVVEKLAYQNKLLVEVAMEITGSTTIAKGPLLLRRVGVPEEAVAEVWALASKRASFCRRG